MSNKTHKKTDTKVKELNFIRFSELQRKYVIEVRNRVEGELNAALKTVYEALDILEKIEKAPPGMYKVRMSDCSGVDVFPVPLAPDLPPDPPKDDELPPPPGKKEKDRTDN